MEEFFCQDLSVFNGHGIADDSPGHKIFHGLLNDIRVIQYEEWKAVPVKRPHSVKYILNVQSLDRVLESAGYEYLLMKQTEEMLSQIGLIYYDTEDLRFFRDHMHGKQERCKIRTRIMLGPNRQILEIWKRNNKGKMMKYKLPMVGETTETADDPASLFRMHAGLVPEELRATVVLFFNRMVLVSPDFTEKITIDRNLTYIPVTNGPPPIQLSGLALVEIRKPFSEFTFFENALKSVYVKRLAVSKYCLGIVMTHPGVKTNSYKPVLLNIDKIIRNDHN